MHGIARARFRVLWNLILHADSLSAEEPPLLAWGIQRLEPAFFFRTVESLAGFSSTRHLVAWFAETGRCGPGEKFQRARGVGDHVLMSGKMTANVAGGTSPATGALIGAYLRHAIPARAPLTGGLADKLAPYHTPTLLSLWITGKDNITFFFAIERQEPAEIFASERKPSSVWQWHVTARCFWTPTKLLKFQSFQGELGLDRQVFDIASKQLRRQTHLSLNGQFPADKTTNLKLTR